jgi:DNA (cytosine-5)-methyltransferase 1
MKHGSLFSGIGGFDLAAQQMGWENIFHCEWNPFGKKILKYYWPQAISYNDITKTDFTKHRGTIDILTGGFPCQPYSQSGKRLGKEDDRHLWPEMLRAIREIQPTWIVGENVRGLVTWNAGLVFEEVQVDLEAEGYEVQPFLLPAAGVNAPHERYRIWFIAYSHLHGHKHWGLKQNRSSEGKSQGERNQREWLWTNFGRTSTTRSASNSCSARRTQFDIPGITKEKGYSTRCSNENDGDASNTQNSYKQWERIFKECKQGQIRRCDSRETWFKNFPTQPPICARNDGFPSQLDGITFPKWRSESIKAAGNAIVPQVALQIFKAIKAYTS